MCGCVRGFLGVTGEWPTCPSIRPSIRHAPPLPYHLISIPQSSPRSTHATGSPPPPPPSPPPLLRISSAVTSTDPEGISLSSFHSSARTPLVSFCLSLSLCAVCVKGAFTPLLWLFLLFFSRLTNVHLRQRLDKKKKKEGKEMKSKSWHL